MVLAPRIPINGRRAAKEVPMFLKMPKTDDTPIVVEQAAPCAVLVVSPDVYAALEAAVTIAFEDPSTVPIGYCEAASELWAGFNDGHKDGGRFGQGDGAHA